MTWSFLCKHCVHSTQIHRGHFKVPHFHFLVYFSLAISYLSCHFDVASTAMPKTTTFKYVSSKSSGSSFSPTSTENIASASPSSLPSPTTTIYYSSSTIQQEKPERKPAPFSVGDRSTWLDATDSQPHEAFFYVELLCNIWFIVEFTTRFLVIIVYVKNGCSTILCVSLVHFIQCLPASFHLYIWSMKQTTGSPVDTLKTLFTNRFDYIVHDVCVVVVHILTCGIFKHTYTNHISWAIILTS